LNIALGSFSTTVPLNSSNSSFKPFPPSVVDPYFAPQRRETEIS